MATSKVVRFYRDHPERNRTIRRRLTPAEAQAHCRPGNE
jgi:hypothetical protein